MLFSNYTCIYLAGLDLFALLFPVDIGDMDRIDQNQLTTVVLPHIRIFTWYLPGGPNKIVIAWLSLAETQKFPIRVDPFVGVDIPPGLPYF